MPVPSSINDLSTTPGSNSPAGSESPATFDDYMRTFAAFIAQLRDGKLASGLAVLLTGNQTIAGDKTFSGAVVANVTGNATASTTVAGLSELATDAEAQAGTDATRAVTPDNLGATVLGMGQTYQDVKASRAVGVTYTNSTGRTIFVAASIVSTSNSSLGMEVNGVQQAATFIPAGNGALVSLPVPPGATYRVTNSAGTPTVNIWQELR